jgi:hypothetical protein
MHALECDAGADARFRAWAPAWIRPRSQYPARKPAVALALLSRSLGRARDGVAESGQSVSMYSGIYTLTRDVCATSRTSVLLCLAIIQLPALVRIHTMDDTHVSVRVYIWESCMSWILQL